MKKEFVPYEIALELKQLGFDEPCVGYYHLNEGYTKGYAFCYFNEPKRYESDSAVLTPTFSQAFRWFREKHNIDAWGNGSFKDCFKPLNECTCDTIGKKQTAMQELKYDLLASLESSSQALEEIEDGIVRQACQMVVKKTLDAIIKRVDGELLEMEKEQIEDAHEIGYINGGNHKSVNGEQYYNETYGGTKK